MGIWDNLKRVFKSNINAAISKAEDPQKILEQTIIDMNEALIENKKAVASAIADEKRLERQYNDNLALAQDWENKAVLAVKSNRDDLAREALLRQKEYADYAVQFKQQFDAQHAAVEKLKDALRQLAGQDRRGWPQEEHPCRPGQARRGPEEDFRDHGEHVEQLRVRGL